jgi:hypothetical protein
VKRSRAPRRSVALRPGAPPVRRASLRRRTPLARGAAPSARRPRVTTQPPGTERRGAFAASDAQRAKIIGGACVVCQKTKGLTPAHLAARAAGGCGHPDCVVPLCWMHHRAYDTGKLDLLGYLEPRWRVEIAHAVTHLGLISVYRRLTGGRLPGADTVVAERHGA